MSLADDRPAAVPVDVVLVARRVPGWDGLGAHHISPLEGGITNRNFVVEAPDGVRCVLRISGKDTDLLGIDRAAEAAANQQAARLGIAPDVLHVVQPEGYLVTRFVHGSPVPELAEPDVMAQVTTALRSFHRSPAIPGRFDCFSIPRTYAATAARRGVSLPAAMDWAMEVADEIRSALAPRREPSVPCHDDLLNANLLRADDGRIMILDWEYAGMGSRWFDLGNLSTNHELDAEGRELLLRAYFGSVTPGQRSRLELMQIMSDLREAMWGVVQQGVSTLGFDYAGYASKHFDRLLHNAGTTTFRSALALAAEE